MLPPAIPGLLQALFAGDETAARKFLDADFGVHDGQEVDDWLGHELSEFARRRPLLNLTSIEVTDRASNTVQGGVAFAVLDQDGRFVFEDALRIGPAGLVRGLGRNFEIVTKMHYTAGRPHRRGVAIRSPRGDIVKAVILGINHDDAQLHPGSSHEDDGFFTLDFQIPLDDCFGRQANLFVRDSAGVSGIEPIYLRGFDSPHQGPVAWPAINGNAVTIAALYNSRLWSLCITLEDGSVETIEHPSEGRWEFPQLVHSAVVTDALDNDWLNPGTCQ